MLFFKKKTKRLKSIPSRFISLSQIASYVVELKEKYGFESLVIKMVYSKVDISRCEFYDMENNDELKKYFSDRSSNQIEDEIYATPFHPFNARTDDDGFTIITKLEPKGRE